ncbi:hypothetical protein ACLMJK_009083 [Lecanora helva]
MVVNSINNQVRLREGSIGPPIVIVGGGIIGFCTAYYLCQSLGTGASIIIVDKAPKLFAGASGKANGILGDYDFVSAAANLGKLSFKLYQELAAKHDGFANWGQRDVMIYDCYRSSTSKSPAFAGDIGRRTPKWFKASKKSLIPQLSERKHAARVNPAEFCTFLKEYCLAKRVRIYLDASVSGVHMDGGSLKSINIAQGKSILKVNCHSLVIAAGPWSERVIGELFPLAQLGLTSDFCSSSGNFLILNTPGIVNQESTECCHQFHLEGLIGRKVDISSRSDGTLYVGGSVADNEELPEVSTDVQPQPQCLREMLDLVAMFLNWNSRESKILDRGRAYRPFLNSKAPVVCRVAAHKLMGTTCRVKSTQHASSGGIFLATGHGRDGIALGPGTGKIMSELILGYENPSVDISGLSL